MPAALLWADAGGVRLIWASTFAAVVELVVVVELGEPEVVGVDEVAVVVLEAEPDPAWATLEVVELLACAGGLLLLLLARRMRNTAAAITRPIRTAPPMRDVRGLPFLDFSLPRWRRLRRPFCSGSGCGVADPAPYSGGWSGAGLGDGYGAEAGGGDGA